MQGVMSERMSASKMVLTVFLPFTLGYFLTAFFNQINAVIAPDIMNDIHLTSSSLGLMTSVYLLCFALFQLPLGVLLDHYGPRRVQFVLFLIAAAGILIFATSNSLWQLTLGRALIGLGMAAGLMAGFKAIRTWYPKEKIPLMNSVMMASGTLGALFSTSPTQSILVFLSWRHFLMMIAVVTVLIALFILIVSKDNHNKSHSATLKDQILSLRVIYKSSYFWRIAPLSAVCFAMNMSMVGLWAGLWFRNVSHFTAVASAHHLFVISIALILGIFSNGFVADKLMSAFYQPITRIMGVGLFLFMLDQLFINFGGMSGSYILWFLFGFLGRSATLSYAALTQYFPAHYAGKAITAINLLMFMSAFIVQYIMGFMIHIMQDCHIVTTTVAAYKIAFFVMIIVQIITFIWFVFYREKIVNE